MGFFDSLFGIDDAEDAIRKAGKKSTKTLQSGYDDVAGMYAPYREGGQQAYGSLMNLSGLTGGPNAGWEAFQQSPIYTSGLDAGIGAIDRSAVGRGGLNSGNTMRDLARFAGDYNTKNFGDFYNRQAGIANQGYSATGAQAGARTGMAQGVAGIQQGVGQGEANAALAGGGLMMSGLGQLANLAGFGLGGGFGGGGGFGIPTSGGGSLGSAGPNKLTWDGNGYWYGG